MLNVAVIWRIGRIKCLRGAKFPASSSLTCYRYETKERSNDVQTRINPMFEALVDVWSDSSCKLKWLQLLAPVNYEWSADVVTGTRLEFRSCCGWTSRKCMREGSVEDGCVLINHDIKPELSSTCFFNTKVFGFGLDVFSEPLLLLNCWMPGLL